MPGLAQIGLVRTKGFSSWLIRVVTASTYNHTVCYVGEGSVVSAETSGVQVMPVEYFPQAVWSDFELTMHQQAKIINFSRAQQGKPYGVLTFLWCGIARLLKVEHTPAWLRRRLASQRNWICSQLCDSAYQAAGIHLFRDHRVQGAVVPADYEPIWEDAGWF
jgi:hypothetical protein